MGRRRRAWLLYVQCPFFLKAFFLPLSPFADGIAHSEASEASEKSPSLPDTPPTEEELASASPDLRKTPKAQHPPSPSSDSQLDPFGSHSFTAHSVFDEQAVLLKRRATLTAEASQHAAILQSIAVTPTADRSTTALALRRFSANPRSTLLPSPAEKQRASISGPSPSATTLARPWHPKPLVLTPARTVHTPITSDPLTPPRRRESLQLPTHRRTGSGFSHASNPNSGSRPYSPGSGRDSPRRPVSASGYARRRSMGYLEPASDQEFESLARRKSTASPNDARINWMLPNGHQRKRSGSEDTGGSTLTRDSSTTHFGSPVRARESPDSSRSGSSMQRRSGRKNEQGSPSLDDSEWEREYFRQAVPLESVDETDVSSTETTAAPSAPTFTPAFVSMDAESAEPSPRTQVEAEDCGLSTTSKPPVLATTTSPQIPFPSDTPLSRIDEGPATVPVELPPPIPTVETSLVEPQSPPLPAKDRPLSPCSPPSRASVDPVTPPRRASIKRHTLKAESNVDSGTSAAESDASPRRPLDPTTPERAPTQLNSTTDSPTRSIMDRDRPRSMTPKKGKPIQIKSVTARSSAANARRVNRLSQIDPPFVAPVAAPITSGGAGSRLSARLSKRLSIGLSSPEQRHLKEVQQEQVQQQLQSGQSTPSPPPAVSKRNSVVPSGLAIWPPPAETKTVSLAPPLAYGTDSELGNGFESATDDEDERALRKRQERERARIGNPSSPPRSSGYSFPGTRRRVFEPRDPRARRDDPEVGDSFLEVLLNSEPPAPPQHRRGTDGDPRWSNYSNSTVDTFRRGSAPSAAGSSGSTAHPKSGGFTKKLFTFGSRSPASGDDRKKPISIAPGGGARRGSKPRPVVSAPLELQAASSAMQQQRSISSISSSSQSSTQGSNYWGSANSSPHQSTSLSLGPPVALRYTGAEVVANVGRPAADEAEELASLYGDGSRRPSLDSVFRPAPKAYALPPGLLSAGDAPPPPPHSNRGLRSPASSAASPSPAQSFSSTLNSPFQTRPRQGSKDSTGSFVSAIGNGSGIPSSQGSPMYRGGSQSSAEPMGSTGMREVLRGQFLER